MSEVAATLGERLKAERERKSLSVQKVADELHLDSGVIDALESGDYARMGPAVYGKGHLKRYLGLLGLPATEMLELYAAESAAPMPIAAPPPATLRMRTSDAAAGDLPWLPLAGAAAAALVIAGVFWWRPWHSRTVASTSAAPAADVAAEPPPVSALTEGASSADPLGAGAAAGAVGAAAAGTGAAAGAVDAAAARPGAAGGAGDAAVARLGAAGGASVAGARVPAGHGAGSETGAGASGTSGKSGAAGAGEASRSAGATTLAGTAVLSSVSAARKAADPNAAIGRARLRLSFSSESWVDVHDALGQRVYAGNGRANSVKTLAGAAPFRVYLRSASGVQLEINNHAVVIGSRFVVGNAARFEAGADGVLRRDTHAPGALPPAASPAHPHG